jgi:hypothetical protein
MNGDQVRDLSEEARRHGDLSLRLSASVTETRPISLLIYCVKCGTPLTIVYSLRIGPRSDACVPNHYPCPECRQDSVLLLPGTLTDSRAGHRPDGRQPA